MGLLSGTCEIVEANDEHNSSHDYQAMHQSTAHVKKWKPPIHKGRVSSLEDDINKLFEAINNKPSSRGSTPFNQVGSSQPSKKDLKKPMRMSTFPSGIGFSEPVSLKQALRGLCISQASEMAAMRRLSKMPGSPSISEAGNIASLYRSVVVEAGGSGLPTAEGREGRVEISLFPESRTSSSLEKVPQYLQEPKLKSNEDAHTSPQFAIPVSAEETGSTNGKYKLKPNEDAHSSPQFAIPISAKETRLTNGKYKTVYTSAEVGKQSAKVESVQEEISTLVTSPPGHSTGRKLSDQGKMIYSSVKVVLRKDDGNNISSPTRLAIKAAPKIRLKRKFQTVLFSSGRVNNNKLCKNAPQAIKPVTKGKSLTKKKSKQVSTSATDTSNAHNNVNCDLDPSTSELMCQKCQCSLPDANNESIKDSPVPPSRVVSSASSSTKAVTAASKPNSILSNYTVDTKSNKQPKSREKGELSQSSKSSICEFSSSTSLSEESSLSGSSFGNRPHMSKDLRWEAIQYVTKQCRFLALGHFNLLKKLGGGDIGTVYLAELIGTNCLYAIKVMDNEFLAKRKKIPRAQTEREILRMLDHPFLPTLYGQFISDNLSCLVMEYCSGGDLHVLRQKQPCRYFTEQAARFYVAEVLLALEYLHMLGIVYRDLKPENIMVREDGHIMLTDFDLSLRCSVNPMLLKSSSAVMEPPRMSGPCAGSNCIDPFCMKPYCQVSCFSRRFLPSSAKARKMKADVAAKMRSLPLLVAEPKDARSNSFVGTHEYLAPEIIKGEGHGSAVDWWTFGVLLYELLYGKTPFKGIGNEETLANVVLQNLRFPDTPLVSFQARDLIRSLLVKEPENRLGSERGAAEIKKHPFFEGLNWALIRCAVPPQLPEPSYIIAPPQIHTQEKETKYLEYGIAGEHLEFELF